YANELPNGIDRPVVDGVNLKQFVATVPFYLCHVGAIVRLLGTDARNPAVDVGYFTLERLKLSNGAAFLAVFDGVVKARRAFCPKQLLYGFGIRKIRLDFLLVNVDGAAPCIIGFLEQPSGIEREHPYRQPVLKDVM